MSEYLHGAYGDTNAIGSRVSAISQSAIVAIGTAPVGQLAGGDKNVNKPILISSIAEARKYFGYSSDWAKYTLCEAFHVFFEQKGVGPLIVINVLDPAKAAHKSATTATKTATPKNGRVVFTGAEDIILDTVVLTAGSGQDETTFVLDTDYTIAYDFAKKAIVATELTEGALGSAVITATYSSMLPSGVADSDVIGTSDGAGSNTGLYAIRNVYALTGRIPAYLIAPGFSSSATVHTAMAQISRKVNNHWDMWMFCDLPLKNGATQLTLDTIAAYKAGNGYDKENESVYFPMVYGTDKKTYHLSVLAAANFLELLIANDDLPFHSPSNTECAIIANLYLGAEYTGRVYDDYIINEKLNKNGINSAAFVSGRWVIWGAHAAQYNQTDGDSVNVAETNRMMLYYISNDFQARRTRDVDQPLSPNDIQSIVAEEQGRLDALVQVGALTYGMASIDSGYIGRSDMKNGDYAFTFDVTTTPLARSLKCTVNWVEDGFETYFDTDVTSE